MIVSKEMKVAWGKQAEMNGSISLAVLQPVFLGLIAPKVHNEGTLCHYLGKRPSWLAGTTSAGDPATTATPREPNLHGAVIAKLRREKPGPMPWQDRICKKNPCR